MSDVSVPAVTGPAIEDHRTSLRRRWERHVSGPWLAAWSATAGALFLALAMAARNAPGFPIDVSITRSVQTLSPTAAMPLDALSVFGFPPVVTISYAVVILALLLARLRWEAVGAGLATLGAAGLTDGIKVLVDRPRPDPALVNVAHHIESFGFPAGHVLNITAFFGFLAYLVWARMAPSVGRTALLVLLIGSIVLMGPARIYAGEHWPTDVLGGYLIALAWLPAPIAIYQWGKARTRHKA